VTFESKGLDDALKESNVNKAFKKLTNLIMVPKNLLNKLNRVVNVGRIFFSSRRSRNLGSYSSIKKSVKDVKRITTHILQEMKLKGERITMLTGYDYSMAKIIDVAGIDIILVGDSASNVMAGHETTLPITLDQMIYHAQAVVRAVTRALVVVDLPFGAYQGNSKAALDSAIRIMKESGAHAVKMEGGNRHTFTMHSRRIDRLSKMARRCDASIFVKNGPNFAGLGEGGEGPTSFTIATPTGEGLTDARSFSRRRRCTLVDDFRIV